MASSGYQSISQGELMPLMDGYPVPHRPSQPMESSVSLRKKLATLSAPSTQLPNPPSDQFGSKSLGSISGCGQHESDSESEDDPLSDEENDEDDALSGLQLHQIHVRHVGADQCYSAKRFAPKLPVSIPGCKDAKQFAIAGASDFKPELASQGVRCALSQGKLLAANGGFTLSVQLVGTCAEDAPCGHGMTVIGLVPHCSEGCAPAPVPQPAPPRPASEGYLSKMQKLTGLVDSAVGKGTSPYPTPANEVPAPATKAAPEVKGWLFACPSDRADRIMNMLGACGCYRTGLTRHFDLDFGGKVGSGAFASVIRGEPLNGGSPVAVKIMKKDSKPEKVLQEVEMLVLAQGNSNIARFRGCFVSDTCNGTSHSLIFDHHPHGDLYDRVAEGRTMMEKDAMGPMYNILNALSFLHDRSIFHRDVKPENILMRSSDQNGDRVVLADFGISCLVTDKERMAEKTGTVGYAAPEMLLGENTGPEGDAFCAGIVLYFMLSKSTPFLAPIPKLVSERTHKCKVNLGYSCFDHISNDCESLIVGLVKKDVQERMTVADAIAVRAVRCYVAATEPNLGILARPKPSQSTSKHVSIAQPSAQPQEFHATVGALPPLKQVPHNLKW